MFSGFPDICIYIKRGKFTGDHFYPIAESDAWKREKNLKLGTAGENMIMFSYKSVCVCVCGNAGDDAKNFSTPLGTQGSSMWPRRSLDGNIPSVEWHLSSVCIHTSMRKPQDTSVSPPRPIWINLTQFFLFLFYLFPKLPSWTKMNLNWSL